MPLPETEGEISSVQYRGLFTLDLQFIRQIRLVLQSLVPEPAVSVLEMQILRSHFRLTKSETLGVGPCNICCSKYSI